MPEVLTQEKESDLDKRIALALGFKPTTTWAIFNADETALMIDFERQAEARKWWDEHPSVHAEHHIGELEQYAPYSTNIEAAMRVVEKMREREFDVCLSNDVLTQYKWECEFSGRLKIIAYSLSDSLAEAICRAALDAMGEKK